MVKATTTPPAASITTPASALLALALMAGCHSAPTEPRPDDAAQTPEPDSVYLFSSFRGNGGGGLHLAYSDDGLEWIALNNDEPFLEPQIGGGLMRDPSIIQGPEGTFHMVWTTGWEDQGLGVAHSDNLMDWSEQQYLPVMEHEPEARNTWAPEIIWDESAQHFVIYWASTIPGAFPATSDTGDEGLNHRIYATTTRDFEHYTDTELFYEPGFNVIDSTIVRHQNEYIMVLKDETRYPPAKNLRTARSESISGPWGPVSEVFTPAGVWVEGPTVLAVGDGYMVYYDEYIDHQYGAMWTRDFNRWENRSEQISFPEGTRHGTAFTVPRRVLEGLEQK